MLRLGFEPTIRVISRKKTFSALHCTITGVDNYPSLTDQSEQMSLHAFSRKRKLNFILVGCILLRYIYVYLSNIPAIETENLLVLLLFSLFTTCFGPYGPSSGEIQLHHLYILKRPSILQRIRCFTIAHSYGVSLLLATLRFI
jgi:hypothetical protein